MEKNKYYQVKNRSASMAVYHIPEDNIRREFAPGETKRISFEELEKLSYQPGGREIMANFLQIAAEEVTKELGIRREVEYDMSEEQIVELLRSGSLDALLDALDFAPVGVIDLIKKFAVDLPLNDIQKCEAIKNKTGFDVMQAVANNKADKEENPEEAAAPVPTRRVQSESTSARRTTSSYKVVTPKA